MWGHQVWYIICNLGAKKRDVNCSKLAGDQRFLTTIDGLRITKGSKGRSNVDISHKMRSRNKMHY